MPVLKVAGMPASGNGRCSGRELVALFAVPLLLSGKDTWEHDQQATTAGCNASMRSLAPRWMVRPLPHRHRQPPAMAFPWGTVLSLSIGHHPLPSARALPKHQPLPNQSAPPSLHLPAPLTCRRGVSAAPPQKVSLLTGSSFTGNPLQLKPLSPKPF